MPATFEKIAATSKASTMSMKTKQWPGMKSKHGNLIEVGTDEELEHVLSTAGKRPVVVNYGAPWCQACQGMLPAFYKCSNDFPAPMFVIVDVDKCSKNSENVRYTPTFRFFREGQAVDEFHGAGPQRLRDRVWLQS
ncbi:hypothetical protein CBR_g19638 [Chara braunii]|uniref:Thioredoxin domain-containing protein n=1 Tax=Chara braunii TaxID=69332 RepID=A0A388KYJ5_CHABU|nr:hypothetical protein CBR_g19638 [Chara braunii]|eukprot:GBG75125.1 hypothetical protein CBR_g19638 [Chara braunii]